MGIPSFIHCGFVESGSVLRSGKAINYQFEIIFKGGGRYLPSIRVVIALMTSFLISKAETIS
ncbi:MAG TPA: hypothetical protein DCY12_08815 [Candidatus Atribacteria bacterium]|nr:hypothetical protein [Candidatus Atribacteria bacterium]HCU21959.1 hypothetical protein [Candidatus Atribacteria bacterium]